MAVWVHQDVLDNGLNDIKNNVNKVVAIIAYSAGDSYATVMNAANIVAESAMTGTDFTLASSGSDRTLTSSAALSDSAANNDGNPTHFAFVDTVNSKVKWVTAESSGQVVTAGNQVLLPSLVYKAKQPTAV